MTADTSGMYAPRNVPDISVIGASTALKNRCTDGMFDLQCQGWDFKNNIPTTPPVSDVGLACMAGWFRPTEAVYHSFFFIYCVIQSQISNSALLLNRLRISVEGRRPDLCNCKCEIASQTRTRPAKKFFISRYTVFLWIILWHSKEGRISERITYTSDYINFD